MTEEDNHELIPSAKRLINSLRDLGYDFSTAVSDLIDNSIDAGSTEICINLQFNGVNSWFSVADNGKGMNVSELMEALRFGSETDYSDVDLGKFGLGLKTASLSQCKKLSVASRNGVYNSEIKAFCWDLDYIQTINKWRILPVELNETNRNLHEPLLRTTGTVVLWEKLDRILDYKNPSGDHARRRIAAMCRELENHISMVFHRFLMGEYSTSKINIYLNGNIIQPWDPFVKNEKNTQFLQQYIISCMYNEVKSSILVDPYVLPQKEDFSSRDAWERASGPKKWNQQQGLYFYRGNRLIQSGGWSKLRTVDEHTKLARVAISFTPTLDDAFKINVAKMRIQVPDEIQGDLCKIIEHVVRIARDRYDRTSHPNSANGNPFLGSNSTVTTSTKPSSQPTSQNPSIRVHQIGSKNSSSDSDLTECDTIQGKKLWTVDEIEKKLKDAANSDELSIIEIVFSRAFKSGLY
ncbi:MAG: ATP-binding protein [Methanospirillum sp.]|uniref:ATP-binding protein n=1 Tax=Methanospirillum sp. TaxID=45200 RepID=UPI00236B1EBC|nr:ATP-binding protein [Methanospirillum sp.]MDD1730305.1 ATP-binding protein [Methanospirillum sp.]